MTRYVVGLLFDDDRSRVVLLRKTHPAWQAGRLNGPGGKCNTGESPEAAMRREFKEEAGVDVDCWEPAVYVQGEDYELWFWRAFSTSALMQVRTMIDEPVDVHSARLATGGNVVPNLRWIIPLAADPCCSLPLVVNDAPSLERLPAEAS